MACVLGKDRVVPVSTLRSVCVYVTVVIACLSVEEAEEDLQYLDSAVQLTHSALFRSVLGAIAPPIRTTTTAKTVSRGRAGKHARATHTETLKRPTMRTTLPSSIIVEEDLRVVNMIPLSL